MNGYEKKLKELLELTEEVYRQAKAVRSKMEDNEDGQLEAVQVLVEKRETAIQQLNGSMQQKDFHWTKEDRKTIAELKSLELVLQPLMTGLYQSFLTQMNRFNQTKQVSKKYIGAYQHTAAGGSFIDKRK